MYDFVLYNDEQIIITSDEAILKVDGDNLTITAIVTNKRLLLLNYPMDKESFRFGKIINSLYKKEVFFERNIDSVKKVEKDKMYTKYTFDDSNFIYLNDGKIEEYFLKKLY